MRFLFLLFIVKSIDFQSWIFIKDSMIKELKSLNWSILVWIHSINSHLKNFVSLYLRMNIQYLSCQFTRQTWWWRLSIGSWMQIDSDQTWYAAFFSSQNPKGLVWWRCLMLSHVHGIFKAATSLCFVDLTSIWYHSVSNTENLHVWSLIHRQKTNSRHIPLHFNSWFYERCSLHWSHGLEKS